MLTLTLILTQFIFRLSFGVAVAMRMTSYKSVTSEFYRVHLWLLMGLNSFAVLAVNSADSAQYPNQRWVFALAIVAAVISYVGSVIWLYEKQRAGNVALFLVSLACLLAAALATPMAGENSASNLSMLLLDLMTGGLLLGVTLSAMLLGHWYLSTPTMQLVPLKRLVLMMAGAIIARAIVCAIGLAIYCSSKGAVATNVWAFLALRWLAGLIGALALARLTWLTLKIPNTQSATGILYAALILVFIGELVSKLLSVELLYPL